MATNGPVPVDPFGGWVHVEWDPGATVTPLGQVPFFTEYRQVSSLCDSWVEQRPLRWTSPRAPRPRDVLGTESSLRLAGWGRVRHVVVLRPRLAKNLAVEDRSDPAQLRLSLTELADVVRSYEYAVLVTSLDAESLSIAAFLHGLRLTAEQLTPTQRW